MPAPQRNIIEARLALPRHMAWIEGHPGAIESSDFQRRTFISRQVRERLDEILLEEVEEAPDFPAEVWHGQVVRNGDYVLDTDDGLFRYRVHTVLEGPLAGKRIIKVKRPGETIYRGFGFITRSGGFQLWRRFASESHLPYVEHLRHIIETTTIHTWLPEHARCSLCNATLDVAPIRPGTAQQPFYLCEGCGRVPTEPDAEFERLLAEEEEIENRTPRRSVTGTRATPRPRRYGSPSREREQAVPVVPMCENTGKYVK